jgi:two-component system, NarL family, response regulator NreC
MERLLMKPAVKVALVDPSAVSLRKTLALLDRAKPDVQIVNVLTGSAQLDDNLCEGLCDVLLLDDSLWSASAISSVLHQIRLRSPNTAILVLSQKLHLAYIKQLFFEGVKGYIFRGDCLEQALLPAIINLSRGDVYMSAQPAFLPYQSSLVDQLTQLTLRDLQVLQLLEEGLKIGEIADQLVLDAKTVYRARNKLKTILDVRTNEKIVPMAYAKGLL